MRTGKIMTAAVLCIFLAVSPSAAALAQEDTAVDFTDGNERIGELLAMLTELQTQNDSLAQELEKTKKRAHKWKTRYRELKKQYDELVEETAEKPVPDAGEGTDPGEEAVREAEGLQMPQEAAQDNGAGAVQNSPADGEMNGASENMEKALQTAKEYLSVMSFSYKGLVEQLKYTGYTEEEAVYAADRCGVNWMDEAVKAAKGYMSIDAVTLRSLTELLLNAGFTQEEADYGAGKAYLG